VDSGISATNGKKRVRFLPVVPKRTVMSKKKEYYKQCRMEREYITGKKIDVAWIPEKFAKVGKLIYILDKPEEIWTVMAIGSRKDETYLKAKEKVQRRYGQSAGLNCE
jgi:hypothetical protein